MYILSIALSIYVVITIICYELMRRDLVDIEWGDDPVWDTIHPWQAYLFISVLWPITFRNVRIGVKRKKK
jgi:hypothetical protein